MKKIGIVAFILTTLFMVGCGEKKKVDLEEKMERYARTYYQTMGTSVQGQELTYEITLGALKDFNESNGIKEKDKFDLSMFTSAGCKDSTKASLLVSQTQQIKKVTIELKCEK